MTPRAIPHAYDQPYQVETLEHQQQQPEDPQTILLSRNLDHTVQDEEEEPIRAINREGSVEHFIHVILKNKYNEIHPNNPNGFVTIDMWIHNQTSTKYIELRELTGLYQSMSDVELWHSLILYYGRIVYRQLMSMDVVTRPDQVVR